MAFGDIPVWVQSVGALLGATGVAAAVSWGERRKDKQQQGHTASDTQVVAASFVEKTLLERLITAITSLHAEVVTLNRHAAELNERMHDEELTRAAVARMRDDERAKHDRR